MPQVRTQIYLTVEQRRRLGDRGRREGRAMASLVREAVDEYLAARVEVEPALQTTFGALPDLAVPDRGEWDRG
jgi:hypothetical protein